MISRCVRSLSLAGLIALVAGCSDPSRVERDWPGLADGTPVTATLYTVTERDAHLALDELREAFGGFAANVLSGTDVGTLGELNREAARDYYAVQDLDLYRCLLLALDYGKASEGAFDPTVGPLLDLYRRKAASGGPTMPDLDTALGSVGWQKVGVASEPRAIRFRHPGMTLDLGGVAKGCALDVGSRVFARPGCLAGLVRMGGNAYAWETPPEELHWRVELPDPRDPSRVLLAVRAANQGLAVSGRRGGEVASGLVDPERTVLDPRSGQPATGDVIAAVALATSASDADALATALYVSGSMRAADLLRRMRKVEAALLIESRDAAPYILASPSLRGRIELSPELERETGGDLRFLLPEGAP